MGTSQPQRVCRSDLGRHISEICRINTNGLSTKGWLGLGQNKAVTTELFSCCQMSQETCCKQLGKVTDMQLIQDLKHSFVCFIIILGWKPPKIAKSKNFKVNPFSILSVQEFIWLMPIRFDIDLMQQPLFHSKKVAEAAPLKLWNNK